MVAAGFSRTRARAKSAPKLFERRGCTSHWLSTNLYRAFHNKTCFELAVNQTGTEPHVTDPPMKTLTAAQQKKLERTMSSVLHSFRFLK